MVRTWKWLSLSPQSSSLGLGLQSKTHKSRRLCGLDQAPGPPAWVSPPVPWSSLGWPKHPSVHRLPDQAPQGQGWRLREQTSQEGVRPAAPHPQPSRPIHGDISETRSEAPDPSLCRGPLCIGGPLQPASCIHRWPPPLGGRSCAWSAGPLCWSRCAMTRAGIGGHLNGAQALDHGAQKADPLQLNRAADTVPQGQC